MVISRKVGVELKQREELRRRKWGWMIACEKKGGSHFLGLRERRQLLDHCPGRVRAPCVVSTIAGTESKEHQAPRSSAKREQLKEEGEKAGRSLMKRYKRTGARTDLCGKPRCTQKERLL